MLNLFKLASATIFVFGVSTAAAATPLLSIYKSKTHHLILVLRNMSGLPTAVYFGMREELHERVEAKRLNPAEDASGYSWIALSLQRTLRVPPAGSAESLLLTFLNEKGVAPLAYAPVGRDAINPKALKALEDNEIDGAAAVKPRTCVGEIAGVSNI